MVVVTHEDKLMRNLETTKLRVTVQTDIPPQNVWAFENYTKEHDQEDIDKSLKYLELLSKCISIGEQNLDQLKRSTKER